EFSEEVLSELARVQGYFSDILARLSTWMDDLLGEAAEPMVHPKYRKSCAEVYLELNELCNFVWLNSEGARKLVKKFDKFHGSSHCQDFIADCDALCEMNRIIEAE
ncbi:hypothetical protein FOZ63_021563, partial [Perkinsus olseni]